MKCCFALIVILCSFINVNSSLAQDNQGQEELNSGETLVKKAKKEDPARWGGDMPDPNRAALYSAVLPGLGQIYNKQYWKLPIIYGGGAVFLYFIKRNDVRYNRYRNALIAETDNNPHNVNPFPQFDEQRLNSSVDFYRRNRDYMIIFACVFYGLNILDAYVDAHLNEFDVSDDLSMKISPTIEQYAYNTKPSFGFKLALKLK